MAASFTAPWLFDRIRRMVPRAVESGFATLSDLVIDGGLRGDGR